jgi:hypothetical protein
MNSSAYNVSIQCGEIMNALCSYVTHFRMKNEQRKVRKVYARMAAYCSAVQRPALPAAGRDGTLCGKNRSKAEMALCATRRVPAVRCTLCWAAFARTLLFLLGKTCLFKFLLLNTCHRFNHILIVRSINVCYKVIQYLSVG